MRYFIVIKPVIYYNNKLYRRQIILSAISELNSLRSCKKFAEKNE